MNLLVALVVAASTIWVYVDATNNKIGKRAGAGGSFNMSAGAWGTVTLLLCIVGFPAYLIKRGDLIKAAQENPVEVSGRGIKIGVFAVLGGLMVLASLPGLSQTAEGQQAAVPISGDTQAATAATPAAAPADDNQPDVSVDGLKVKTDNYGVRSVTGVATNNTDKHLSYVQVEINLYDKSGAQVGSTLDNVNNLEPHGKWKFSAPITEDSATAFKFKGVTAY